MDKLKINDVVIDFLSHNLGESKLFGPINSMVIRPGLIPKNYDLKSEMNIFFLCLDSEIISEISDYEKIIYFTPEFYLKLMNYFSLKFDDLCPCVINWIESHTEISELKICRTLTSVDFNYNKKYIL
jgi:hypothetical protein